MQRFRVLNSPSDRRINGAYHQDGLILLCEGGRSFGFEINGSLSTEEGFKVFTGTCYEFHVNSPPACSGRLEMTKKEKDRTAFLEIS